MKFLNVTPEELAPMEFVEVWSVAAERKPSMAHRRDICDENHGQPVEVVGYPPAHPNCECETVVTIRFKDGE